MKKGAELTGPMEKNPCSPGDDVCLAVLKAKFLIEQPFGQGAHTWKEEKDKTDRQQTMARAISVWPGRTIWKLEI